MTRTPFRILEKQILATILLTVVARAAFLFVG